MHTPISSPSRRENLKPLQRLERLHPTGVPWGAVVPARALSSMNHETITLIPPGTGGVRDYAEIVGRHIQGRLLQPTRDTPLFEYGSGDVVLNFSGYGYHPRGIPTWLVERLVQLRARGSQVGVFFHELFATEPPWRSGFWLGPLQRRIASDLAHLASYWLTNCEAQAQWLRRNTAPVPHRVLPVFSNVGELDARPEARSATVVVFGSPSSREQVYRRLDDEFWQWVSREQLSVHDIGPPIGSPEHHRLCDLRGVHRHGSLPAEQVSEQLAQARFGLLWYPPHVLAKSGVFAAYSAHGVSTILLAESYAPHDGLVPNRHFAAGLAAIKEGGADAPELGHAAFDWYQPHRIAAHVQAFRDLARARV